MTKKRFFLKSVVLLLVLTGLFSCSREQGSLEVADMQVESLENPLGINTLSPRFSWENRSDRNGAGQSAYQIIVASEKGLLDDRGADLWNSGKISSAESLFVPYAGESLMPGQHCFWKVRVWDDQGQPSPWSGPAEFLIGLLEEKDWQGDYISLETDGGYRECPQFFHAFNVEEAGQAMFLHVNSLGYHEVYLNGDKVGNSVLTPAVSQFNKRSLVNTYDVSGWIQEGENELMIWLGSGWYTKGLPGVTHDGPVVRAQLETSVSGQPELVLGTGSSWRGRISSYRRHGTWRPHRFGGEIIDGTLAKHEVSVHHASQKSWQPVTEIAVPAHEVTPQMAERNAITDTITPTAMLKLSEKTWLIDMGRNLTGWFEIAFPPHETGQEIKLEYCDHLDENNQFVDQNQVDYYIASGEENEVFKNKFNYHGFRYVRITNMDDIPQIDSVRAYLIHTGFDPSSGFECSDMDLNDIHDMVQYTLRCLTLGGYMVDCPQLERLGYGGDGNASTQTAQIMYQMLPLYKNWLQAWADCIRENGSMPHTAPNPYSAGGGPYWCGFIISAAWKSWVNYGDQQILEDHYPVMKKWLEYVDKYSPDGLLKQWPNTEYRNWYLGDWATPEGIDQTDQESVDLVNNCAVSVFLDQVNKVARVLGKPGEAAFYSAKRDTLNQRIHATFFDASSHTYATGTQIDMIYPLLAGVVPEHLVKDVKARLFQRTKNVYEGHLATGLVGIPVMMEWARTANEPDFVYSMLKKRDYPGFLYMLENGATATWEHWDGQRSRIHNCYNSIGQWFYEVPGGIRPVEGTAAFRQFLIDPQPPEHLSWAKTWMDSPYGTIRVDWNLDDGKMGMNVEVPVGATAKLCLPAESDSLHLNNELFPHATDTVLLKSGSYLVEYNQNKEAR